MGRFLLTVLLLAVSPFTGAADGMSTVQSAHPVAATVDRLAQGLKTEGFTIFARIDHGAGAERVAMTLPASELLIFGKPAAGTVLLQAAPAAGIDLPLKIPGLGGHGRRRHRRLERPALARRTPWPRPLHAAPGKDAGCPAAHRERGCPLGRQRVEGAAPGD